MELHKLLSEPVEKPTLIVDTQRCRYSCELSKELSQTNLQEMVITVDIGSLTTDEIEKLEWLPGVPVLVESNNIHLGVDAFTRCRQLARESFLR